MPIESEHRFSDSPYVRCVWRGRTSGAEDMTSVATSNWEIVFWEDRGVAHAGVRGPETGASTFEITGDSESFGITFVHGASMPHLPPGRLVDGAVQSPHVGERTFVLGGQEWEIPDFENAEQFVERLVHSGMLIRDPLVDEIVRGGVATVGARTVQRRVSAATGLTQCAIGQIERARQAAVLLGEGSTPVDVTYHAGYYDQPHLARSLRRFIGRTATQLQRHDESGRPLSLLYKTEGPEGS